MHNRKPLSKNNVSLLYIHILNIKNNTLYIIPCVQAHLEALEEGKNG